MGIASAAAGVTASLARTAVRRLRRGPRHPEWSLFTEAIFAYLHRAAAGIDKLDPRAQRARFESMVIDSPVLKKVRRTPLLEPLGEWIEPLRSADARTILYLHGGGYVTGSLRSHEPMAAEIALHAGARALLLDYRLAPEHALPAAIDDTLAAVRWLYAQKIPPAQIVIAGDSAGGGLSLAALIALRDAGEPLPAGALLISPWLDHERTLASHRENAKYEWLPTSLLETWSAHYRGDVSPRDPRVSAVHADLRGLPPMLIQIGGAEVLRDEGRLLAERAKAAGVRVELQETPAMNHDFQMLSQVLAPARRALALAGAFVREVTGEARKPPATVDAAPERIPG